MGLKNGLIFGGINSLDYGIYISGDAVFNAPSRKVDLIQIPGRNGDFALDHGRFENIEVSYPAGTFGEDQKDFREKLSDFRNAILSQVGYQRLSDTYHPDEYRLGVYMSGLDVDPAHYNTAGEFILTFNCKPQRWLTSGEEAVTIGEWGETETVSGEVVEVEATDTDAVKSLVADIVPIQSGSGTPSPQNIRPISGSTEVNITVTDDLVSPTQTEVTTAPLGRTVYGGTLDLVSGELTVTHKYISAQATFASSYNTDSTHANALFGFNVNDSQISVNNNAKYGIVSNLFEEVTFNQALSASNEYYGTYLNNSTGQTIVRVAIPKSLGILTVADFNTWLTSKGGIQIAYPLATPQTYQLTPQQIELLLGENNIWADSGNVTLEYGQNPSVLINPTLFASSPLLEVYGYGDIDIGGQAITVENGMIGYTIVRNESSTNGVLTQTIQFDTDIANVGDDIYVGGAKFTSWWQTKYDEDYYIVSGTSSAVGGIASFTRFSSEVAVLSVDTTSAIFSYGTSSTLNTTGSYSITIDDDSQITVTGSIALSYAYDGDSTITITATQTIASHFSQNGNRMTIKCGEIAIESTKTANGNPMYIDLDIGECWNEDSGTPVSVNNAVIIPSKLPTLPSGNTAITFDNTITKLEVTPRWWKV